MQTWITEAAPADRVLRILEAGCGRRWPFRLEDRPHHIVGIDLDPAALEIRMNRLGDLHEAIVGDLCTYPLPEAGFDVVYCSFVLEHIPEATRALDNLVRATRENGLLLIRVPDSRSVQGFVTRITPHCFHVFYYRWILGNPNAGKPGMGPYPTHYTPVIGRAGMEGYCADPGNGVRLEGTWGDGYIQPGRGWRRVLIRCAKFVVYMLSLGSLSYRHTDLLFVLRRTSMDIAGRNNT